MTIDAHAALTRLNDAAYAALRACNAAGWPEAKRQDLIALATQTDRLVDDSAVSLSRVTA